MKMIVLTMLMMQMGVLAEGQSGPSPADTTVPVCVESDAYTPSVARAKVLASQMFGEIGLSIVWENGGRRCPAEAILVKIGVGTPVSLMSGAFAYAKPYEGKHIQIFYDRIHNAFSGVMVQVVLAHVLVHEITHILEGVSRHSEWGVMKAAWDSRDYFHMKERPLEFAELDVVLIHRGLAARQERATLPFASDRSGVILVEPGIHDTRTLEANR